MVCVLFSSVHQLAALRTLLSRAVSVLAASSTTDRVSASGGPGVMAGSLLMLPVIFGVLSAQYLPARVPIGKCSN